MSNIEILKQLVEESQVSDRQCAELTVLLSQVQLYVAHKSGLGDLFAQNLVTQMVGGEDASTVL